MGRPVRLNPCLFRCQVLSLVDFKFAAKEIESSPNGRRTQRSAMKRTKSKTPSFRTGGDLTKPHADNADSADSQPTTIYDRVGAGCGADHAASPQPNRVHNIVQELLQGELFHDEQKRPYASVSVGGQSENLEIGSAPFNQHLAGIAYRRWRRTLNKSQQEEVVSIATAKAVYEGPTHPVYLRVAPGANGFYIDIGDAQRRCVEVTPNGWQTIQSPPVRFRRPPTMGALPLPTTGGAISDLRPFLNCTDEGFKMIVGFVLASFRTKGPYPILELVGEKGTSKSTTTRLVQALIDPSQAQLGSPIHTEEQLAVRANHSWLVTLDNCSGASDALSDMLCRLATGGAYSARQLYTDSTQTVINYCRPCVINGIENIAKRSDLLDRCWGLELSRISTTKRKTENQLWSDFDVKGPGIFGAICDALVTAVREEGKVNLKSMDRLADAERWVTAASAALGWQEGAFQAVLRERRTEVVHRALDEHREIWDAMKRLAANAWSGSVPQLQEELGCKSMKASAFGGLMRRLTPDLAAVGIELKKFKQGHSSMRGYSVKSVVGTVGAVGSNSDEGAME